MEPDVLSKIKFCFLKVPVIIDIKVNQFCSSLIVLKTSMPLRIYPHITIDKKRAQHLLHDSLNKGRAPKYYVLL